MLKNRCQACGLIFMSTAFGGVGYTLSNISIEESCPKCGGRATADIGEIFMSPEGPRYIRHTPWTAKLVDELRAVARKAKEERLTASEIISEVADINPELAEKLQRRGLPAFTLILLIIWMLKSFTIDVKVDVNRLIDQGLSAIAAENENGAAPQPPTKREDDFSHPTQDESLPTMTVAMLSAPPSRRARRRARGRTKRHPR